MKRSGQLIEEPDRLIVRPSTVQRALGLLVTCFILFVLVLGLLAWQDLRTAWAAGWWQIPPFAWLGTSVAAAFLLVFSVSMPFTLTISANGWVRQGIVAWHFPGPMRVRGDVLNTRGNPRVFELGYGAASVRLGSPGSKSETEDWACRIAQWARSRVGGIPDAGQSGHARGDRFMTRWGWSYAACAALVLAAGIVAGRNGDYLNPRAALGALATGAAAAVALAGLAVAGWHWARLARREIKAGAVVWALDMLAALLLIAAGCCVAERLGQLHDMRTLPSHEVTLHQPVRYHTVTIKSNCTVHLRIEQPALEESVDYEAGGCDANLGIWKNAAGVEVRQAENALGVHILSVRPIQAR